MALTSGIELAGVPVASRIYADPPHEKPLVKPAWYARVPSQRAPPPAIPESSTIWLRYAPLIPTRANGPNFVANASLWRYPGRRLLSIKLPAVADNVP
jgi:hypothetical protein